MALYGKTSEPALWNTHIDPRQKFFCFILIAFSKKILQQIFSKVFQPIYYYKIKQMDINKIIESKVKESLIKPDKENISVGEKSINDTIIATFGEDAREVLEKIKAEEGELLVHVFHRLMHLATGGNGKKASLYTDVFIMLMQAHHNRSLFYDKL